MFRVIEGLAGIGIDVLTLVVIFHPIVGAMVILSVVVMLYLPAVGIAALICVLILLFGLAACNYFFVLYRLTFWRRSNRRNRSSVPTVELSRLTKWTMGIQMRE
jgi:hypothetical protein